MSGVRSLACTSGEDADDGGAVAASAVVEIEDEADYADEVALDTHDDGHEADDANTVEVAAVTHDDGHEADDACYSIACAMTLVTALEEPIRLALA